MRPRGSCELELSVELFKGEFDGFSSFCLTLSIILFTLSGVSIYVIIFFHFYPKILIKNVHFDFGCRTGNGQISNYFRLATAFELLIIKFVYYNLNLSNDD